MGKLTVGSNPTVSADSVGHHFCVQFYAQTVVFYSQKRIASGDHHSGVPQRRFDVLFF